MNKYILVALFCYGYACTNLNAQTPPAAAWVNQIGGSRDDESHHVVIDGNGNAIIIGQFEGTVDFDPSAGTANLTAVGNKDIFVAKYTSAGAYSWAFKIGSVNYDAGEGITVDGGGNVYVTGRFQGTADFNPSGVTNNLTAAGLYDVFVAKYTSSGTYTWAFKIGGSATDQGNFITYDATGYIYVTGKMSNLNVDFDPSTNINYVSSTGNTDIFLAKYSATLTPTSTSFYQWAFKIGSANEDVGFGVTTDGSGNAFITGSFQNTADFNPSATINNLTAVGDKDIFLAKYSSAGAYQWAVRFGSVNPDEGNSVIYSSSASAVYVTGYFAGTVDFDPSALTNNIIATANDDAFVGKYTAASGALSWIFKIGSSGDDSGEGINTDASGNVYVTGKINGSADFDPSASTYTVTSGGSDDIFVGAYTSAKALTYAFGVGVNNDQVGYGITVDNVGDLYVTGMFDGGAMDFDPTGTAISKTSLAGSDDAFLAKYGIAVLLPIQVIAFNAETCSDNLNVCVNWSTANEENTHVFTVQKSTDGNNFYDLQSVNAAGNSIGLLNYTITDKQPALGTNYYRLKQINLDGSEKYSEIKTVNFDAKNNNVSIAPNPTVNNVQLQFFATENANTNITIRDHNNKIWQTINYVATNGLNHVQLNVNTLPAGVYMVTLQMDNQRFTQKLIKL